MKKLAIVAALLVPSFVFATTSNLDNHGQGDSAATVNTFMLRDANGISAIPVVTTTTLATAALAAPLGSLVLAQESVAGALVTNSFNLCASTANAIASWIYVSVSTGTNGAGGLAQLGAACAK